MLNQTILVGRLTSDPQINEVNDKKVANITLAVARSFKNADGEYETDFINCTLWQGIAENTAEYCHKGDIIGVKGRLQTRKTDDDKLVLEVVAEKVTFLSSKKENEESGN